MSQKIKNSSLLAKYTLQYKRKPRSRVFAPLAETYRKLGMYEDAFKVLKEGIKHNPSYVLGYIVLANCYYDQQNYELSYNTIRPFVSDNLENISLQKLFAQTCINLGYLEEALETFKFLLLLNPRDEYVAKQVKLLEDDLLINEDSEDLHKDMNRLTSFEDDEDHWVQVDFNRRKTDTDDDILDSWSVENDSPLEKFKNDIKNKNLNIDETNLDDEYFHEDYDNSDDDLEVNSDPIITHTLVDLYIKQGHYRKAIEILESILELHPNDRASRKKLKEVMTLDSNIQTISHDSSELTEESDNLLKLVDENKKSLQQNSLKILENKLTIFLEKIKKVALEKQQSYS
jgi:tetratricopeptide (TPR) repeat protein